MPRRRKKKKMDGPELPPLQFVESPLNQSPLILSPDFGAINPITARAVAVENHDLSWVSPQFVNQGQYSSRQCTNQTSRRMTRLRHKSGIHHHDQNLKDVASKYKPLSFVTNGKPSRLTRPSHDGNETPPCNRHPNTKENQNSEPNCRDSYPYEGFTISTPVINRYEADNDRLALAPEFSPSKNRSYGNPLSRRDKSQSLTDGVGGDLNVNSGGGCENSSSDSDGVCRELSVIFGEGKKLCLFECSSSPSPSPLHVVLAADTPECDYGMTMRQKQLKYCLRTRHKR